MADPEKPDTTPAEGRDESKPKNLSSKPVNMEDTEEVDDTNSSAMPELPADMEPDGAPFDGKKKPDKKRRRKKILITLGIVVVLLAAAGVSAWKMKWYRPVLDRYNRAAVTFKVKEDDKFAVQGAVVAIDGHSATTDDNGRVYITGLVAGSRNVTVKADGYDDLSQSISLKRGENDPIILSLKKQTAKLYSIKGYVQDYISGKPLVNVQVSIGDKNVLTDPSGAFSLNKQPAGDFTMGLSASGYVNASVKDTVKDADLALNKLTLVPTGQVVFVSNQNGKRDLYTVGYDGQNSQPLLQARGDGENFAPLISPDRKYVLFSSTRDKVKDNYGSDLVKLYIADIDGKNVHKVSDDVSAAFTPVWSSAGDRVYYYGYTTPKLDQGVHEIYDAKQNKLMNIGEDAMYLAFSPDGSTVAYQATAQESQATPTPEVTASPSPGATASPVVTTAYALKTYNVVNGERRTLAKREQYINEIRFSADGKTVSYDTIVNNTRARFQVNADGTNEISVNLLANSSRSYVMSPDGSQMAFIEERDGKKDLYTVTKEETGEKRLTRVGVVNAAYSPAWDATTKYITFAVRREAEVALYVVGVAGGEPRKITDYYEPTSPIQ